MEKDTIRNYLKRAEFNAVQSDTLADILSEQAPRSDVHEPRAEVHRFAERMDGRFATTQQMMDEKIAATHRMMDEKLRQRIVR